MSSIGSLVTLEDRRALVTGAAGHVGKVAANTLTELGARTVLLDQSEEACASLAKSLNQRRDGCAVPVACDLQDEQATRSAVRSSAEKLGGLDIVVHCAGYVGTTQSPGWAVPFERQTVQAWDAALRVNLTAAFVVVQEAKEHLSSSGYGSVVLFSSIYGMVAPDMSLYAGTEMANPVGYGASKGGLLQLMQYLATLLAPRVRVNCISPGGIERGQPRRFVERYCSRTPLGRLATEDDLRGAVAFLASDMSGYVTGHNLVVDGGWTAW